NPRGDYGPSEFDVRHRFVLSGFYELPFAANRLVGGWEVGTVFQAQSGNPLNPTMSINPGVSLTVRPNVTGTIKTTGDPADWFGPLGVAATPTTPAIPGFFASELSSPCAVSTTGTCHPGNLSRNAVTGPSFVNTDFSVIKNTKLTEKTSLQFRTEMFDIFNHRSEEHTSELQSLAYLVCRLLLEKKNQKKRLFYTSLKLHAVPDGLFIPVSHEKSRALMPEMISNASSSSHFLCTDTLVSRKRFE